MRKKVILNDYKSTTVMSTSTFLDWMYTLADDGDWLAETTMTLQQWLASVNLAVLRADNPKR